MADQITAPAFRITRKQTITIAVLGTALFAALMWNPSNDPTKTTDATSTSESVRRRSGSAPTQSAAWKPNWPEATLEKLLKQNPFAPLSNTNDDPTSKNSGQNVASAPEATPPVDSNTENDSDDEVAAAQRRKAEEALSVFQSQKVKLTLRSGEKLSALIGNRVVSEGEIIDGVRVVSILPTGVLVETVTTEP